MTDKYHQLAKVMGVITEDVLWQSPDFHQLKNDKRTRLKTRVGSGLATYCRFDQRQQSLSITYGKKMVRSKFNLHESVMWMSHREIIKRNYFNGDTGLINLLAHTVCHEFAHAIQQMHGKIYKGSVHNQHFYDLLDQLHIDGHADTVKQHISQYCQQASIDIRRDAQSLKHQADQPKLIKLDSQIQFTHKNKSYTGKVIKVNRKTVIVKVRGLIKHTVWKVPISRAIET